MDKTKRSTIWGASSEDFIAAFHASNSLHELIGRFVDTPRGSTTYYKVVKRRIEEEGLNIEEIKIRSRIHLSHISRERGFKRQIPLEEVLVRNSSYSRTHLKKRLLAEGLLTNKCDICTAEPIWKGKPLNMVLDHINGEAEDNRLENLRLLCPNCNSQTDTFCRTSMKKPQKEKEQKPDRVCPGDALTKELLERIVWEKTAVEIGAKYGISDSAVIKRCRKFNIDRPARGYWSKQKK